MNLKQPLVSVIITNYNYGHYIEEAINSVLNQSYSNLEIIVVDDGSIDNSKNIINNYGDKIISLFKNNGGQASAINAGFAVSQGDIICSLDADDTWLPAKVESVVEAMNQHSQAVIAYHKVQNINQHGELKGEPWPPYSIIKGDISRQVGQTGSWWPWPPSTALSFRRTFLTQVMNIPEEEGFHFSAEPYLADLAPFFGEVIGINQVLSLFRLHQTNNWSHPVDIEKRSLKNYEFRIKVLNNTLKKHEINVEINLADHWPYQLLRYKIGYEDNLFHLSKLAWQNPWVSNWVSKFKTISKLWLHRIGFNSPRL